MSPRLLLTRLFLWPLLFVAGLLTLAAFALILVDEVDLSPFREKIESRVSDVLTSDIEIDGRMTLSPSLHPVIALEDIRDPNETWASHPYATTIDRIEIELDLLALIGDTIVIDAFRARGTKLWMEQREDGVSNWDVQQREGGGIVDIRSVDFDDLTIFYQSGQTQIEISEATLSASLANGNDIEFSGQATVKDVPLIFSGSGPPPAKLFAGSRPIVIHIETPLGGSSLRLESSFDTASPIPGIQLDIESDNLELLSRMTGTAVPELGPLRVNALLIGEESGLRLDELKVRIGETQVSGNLSLDQSDEVARLEGNLQATKLRVADFIPVDDTGEAAPGADKGLPVQALRAVGAELQLSVDELHVGIEGLDPIRQASLQARIGNGKLVLSQVEATLPHGAATGHAELDGNAEPALLKIELLSDRVDYGALLADLDITTNFTGIAKNARGTITASGTTLGRWADSLYIQVTAASGTFKETLDPAWEPHPIDVEHFEWTWDAENTMRFHGQGTHEDRPVALDLTFFTAREGEDLVEFAAVRGTASLEDNILSFEGTLAGDFDIDKLTGKMSLTGSRFSSLEPAFDVPDHLNLPYKISANLNYRGEQDHVFHDIAFQLGKSRGGGTLHLDRTQQYSQITGDLTSTRLDLPQLLGLPTAKPRGKSANKDEILLDEPIAREWLNNDQRLDLSFRVEELIGLPQRISKVSGRLKLENKRLSVDPLRLVLGDSAARATVSLDSAGEKLEVSGRLTTLRIDLGHLARTFAGMSKFSGSIERAHIEARTRGNTPRELARALRLLLDADETRISLLATGRDKPYELTLDTVNLELFPKKQDTISVKGWFRQVPLTITLESETVGSLTAPRNPFPVALSVTAGDTALSIQGNLELGIWFDDLNLNIRASGPNLATLGKLLDTPLPEIGAYELSSDIQSRAGQIKLRDTALRFGSGELHLNGTLIDAEDGPRLTGSLSTDRLVLDAVNTDSMPTPGPASGSRTIPNLPISLDVDPNLNAALKVDLRNVSRGQRTYAHIKGDLQAAKGILYLQSLEVSNTDGGFTTVEASIDTTAYVPRIAIAAKGEDIDLGWVWHDEQKHEKVPSWRNNVKLDLRGDGATLRDFLAGANGSITLVGGPLEIDTRVIDLWVSDLITIALPKFKKQERRGVTCAVGRFDLVDGIATSDGFVIDTTNATIAGHGSINLREETLDLAVSPRPKKRSFLNVATGITIKGSFSKPKVRPASADVARNSAKVFLAYALPISMIVSYSVSGSHGKNACQLALEEVERGLPVTGHGIEGMLDQE